jgi:hypothetical protein
MPLTNFALFIRIKEELRLHPDWSDDQVTERLDLRQKEQELIDVARKDLEAG